MAKRKNKTIRKKNKDLRKVAINAPKKTVTLCMIVKNETDVLQDCFDSVKDHIDYWVICDTGSTDGTQQYIKHYFKKEEIPGELHEHEWEDFGTNRSKAMEIAEQKADYILVIDADDKLEGNVQFPVPLEADAYRFRIMLSSNFSYMRNQLFKSSEKWRYAGVLHEYAYSSINKEARVEGVPDTFFVSARSNAGARSKNIDPITKYSKDSITLKNAIVNEPDNTRYQFYLAQSYFDSKQFNRAKEAYIKRFNMGGWPEEVYYSLFRVAQCNSILKEDWNVILTSFLNAHAFRPSRAEPLYELSKMFRLYKKQPAVAYTFAKRAAEMPYPKDLLFVSSEIYQWRALDEVAATAFQAGQIQEGYKVCKALLNHTGIPEPDKERIAQNLDLYKQHLKK